MDPERNPELNRDAAAEAATIGSRICLGPGVTVSVRVADGIGGKAAYNNSI